MEKPTEEGDSSGSGPRQSSCTVTSLGSISGTATRSGSWASDCDSVNRSGKYARFYSFSVSEASDVQIDLESTDSPAVDTYMYLLSGAGTSGSVVESDDDGGSGRNSQIVRQLSAGSYTVEATTFLSATTGNFSLSISASPACRVTLGTITGTETRSGSWASDCESVNSSGKYAQFYTFTVGGTADVQIDLESTDSPAVDTYMYLLSGAGTGGSVVERDDDDGSDKNSQIVRRLSAGSYTVEATTFSSATTGNFTVTIQVSSTACTATSLGEITGTVTQSGSWASDCDSVNRSGKYARFYSFSVAETSDVQIDLESTDSPVVDTYMYLLSGAGTDGSVLESDDDDGPGLNSQIVRELSAGNYTVEATTLLSGTTGNFTVTIQVTAVPPPECAVTSLGAITGSTSQTGSWSSDCMSVNRSGKYAQFYSFSVSGTANVQIDLESTDVPAVDTYMYLISGGEKDGSVLEFDDDGGDNRNSRIVRQLSAGTYTVEATTFSSALTGNFTLTIDVPTGPEFAQDPYSFTVEEGATNGTSVGTVSASNTTSYSITAGNSAGKFTIGSTSGTITVAGSLDHETTGLYSLTVQASDGSLTDTATVAITVTDVNEISIGNPGDVTEGGDMTFTVTAESGGVTVTYGIGGTATAGDDYVDPGLGPLAVTLAAGETSASITIDTNTDSTDETYETVVITLTGAVGGGGVIDSANSSAEGAIADLVEGDAISNNDTAAAIEVTTPNEASSRIQLKIPTSRPTLANPLKSWNFSERAFVVRVQARVLETSTSTSTEDVPATIDIAKTTRPAYTTSLPGYSNLGNGQFVWVEPTDPDDDRYILLTVQRPSWVHSVSHYIVTVSKPDFAIVGPPTLSTAGATSSVAGKVTLTVTIRNSTGSASGGKDSNSSIVIYCTKPGVTSFPESFGFDELRSSGSTDLIGSKSQTQVAITTACQGAALDNTDRVSANALVKTPGWEQPWATGDDTFRWPFDVDTPWHAQSTITGGLQLTPPNSVCTLSFPLSYKTRGASGAGSAAMSTTAHCYEAGQNWEQGSYPEGAPGNVALGTTFDPLLPSNRDCEIRDDNNSPVTKTNCHRGDQAYATGQDPTASRDIFRPGTENSLNLDADLPIEYFARDTSDTFKIVGARPPQEGDIVHKVGRTTGWTSGRVKDYTVVDDDGTVTNLNDSTCPGNELGTDNHFSKGHDKVPSADDYYIECLVWAAYQSEGGDSGSPVFVEKDPGSTNSVREVLLVGVHYGGAGDLGLFIPIDRIYAESLLQGYDWTTPEIRPVPALDDPMDESLELEAAGWSIVATFLMKDFGHGLGTKYEAVLHRVGSGGLLAPVVADGGNPYAVEISHSNPIARFDVLNIPSDQRSGEFRVKVRMCPYEVGVAPNTNACSDYGSDGGKSIKLPPAPQNFTSTSSSRTQVEVSWDLVPDTTGYEFDYREQGTTDWLSRSGSEVTSPAPIPDLSCDTTYEFIVRAYGDGSPYDMTWGFWSEILTASTGSC